MIIIPTGISHPAGKLKKAYSELARRKIADYALVNCIRSWSESVDDLGVEYDEENDDHNDDDEQKSVDFVAT